MPVPADNTAAAEAAVQSGGSPVTVSPADLIGLAHAGESLPLRSVRIRARQSGLFLSPFKGRGMEFDESRPYQPGDDVRSLDWKVTARTGRAHTKLFREERERPVLVWVDLRRAMFFATRGAFKAVIAARAAALLGWGAAAHRDRLGGLIFSEDVHREIKPRRGKPAVLHFIQSLCRHPAWENGHRAPPEPGLDSAMLRLVNVSHPGSLVFLLSDFRGFNERAQQHLGRIARHNDVVMIPVHDPLEQALPPPGRYRLADQRAASWRAGIPSIPGHNHRRSTVLDSHDEALKRDYAERARRHRELLLGFCRRHRIYHLPLSTADAVVPTLQSGLGLRKRQ